MNYNDLKILFEDNHLLVVVKPMNVPVQADNSGDPDMVNMLKSYLIKTYDKPGDAYLGLVHRLDRPTGGVMVFAKTSKCAERLCMAIRNGDLDKKYLAIVEGTPRYKSDKVYCYLKKFPESNMVKIVPALTEGSKYAELDYKVLAEKNGRSLVSVKLITGRGHQIRVQMAGIGNPIVGDKRYGNDKNSRYPLCLWATELHFSHPISGEMLTFRVYPPEIAPWTSFNVDAFLRLTAPTEDYDD